MKKASFPLISVVIMVLGLFSIGYSERGIQVQEKRFALVIGNGNYKSSPLKNPTNDAYDMAIVLKTLGFEVTHLENAEYRAMERAIRKFGKQLQNGGAGLFYFAGHGIQVDGRNYLIPIDAEIETESDVKFEAVDAGRILGKMEDAENDLNIVILDACRDNPFARSFRASNQGLARMDAPKGSLIAYATAPGSVAADGEGRNGVYTKYLIENAMTPGLTVEQVLKKVRIEVLKETNNKQVPWESSSLTGNFYFNPIKTEVKPAIKEQQEITKNTQKVRIDKDYEILFWESIKESKDAEAFKEYLKKYPNGTFAGLARMNIKKHSQQIEEKTTEKLSDDHFKKKKENSKIAYTPEDIFTPKDSLNMYRLGLLPWLVKGMNHDEIICDAIKDLIESSYKNIKIKLSFYEYSLKNIDDILFVNPKELKKNLWKKESWWNYIPDVPLILDYFQKMNIDLALLYKYDVTMKEDYITAYLIDIKKGTIYESKGTTTRFNQEGHDEVQRITKNTLKFFLNK